MATPFTGKEIGELKKLLSDKREALRTFRFQSAGTHARNVREGRTIRKEIAQILTEMRAQEISKKIAPAKDSK